MKKLLKVLHVLGSAGVIGALVVQMLLVSQLPLPSLAAEYVTTRQNISRQ